ncbi:MAG: hypothetical protein MI922_01125 [Bacteroidales bacterium]|nr:hypothetical protein [Bacteroidales bacterium]
MKTRILFFALVFSIAVSCTSIPPRIENGMCVNPKYEYSFKVPDSWINIDVIPEEYKNITLGRTVKDKIVFLNSETNGIITITNKTISTTNKKTIIDLDSYSRGQVRKEVEKLYKKLFLKLFTHPNVEKITFDTTSDPNCKMPCSIGKMNFQFENEFIKLRIREEIYIDQCEDYVVCNEGISLFALKEIFENSENNYLRIFGTLDEYKKLSNE